MLPDRLALAHDVDVRAVSVQGEVVMVMGGGMTACQLACAALDHGAAQVLTSVWSMSTPYLLLGF